MKQKTTTSYTVNTSYELEYDLLSSYVNTKNLNDADALYIVQLIVNEETTGSFNKKTSKVWSDIITEKHYNELLAAPHDYENIAKNNRIAHPIALIKPQYLDFFVKYGSYGELSKLEHIENLNRADYISTNPFQDIVKPEFTVFQYLNNHNLSYYMKDIYGKNYITPIILDYTDGSLDNSTFELDGLVEHLSTRKDVAFLLENNYSKEPSILYGPLKGDEKGLNRIIQDIPSYNADEDRTESIAIVYYPQEKDVERLLNWNSKEDPNKFWSVKQFIISEVLEGKQFSKIQVVPEAEPETPKRKFKR